MDSKKRLGLFWWIGFTLSAITTVSASAAHLSLQQGELTASPVDSEIFDFEDFQAWWPETSVDDSLTCELYESCVFLVVRELTSCEMDAIVSFTVTDEEDRLLGQYQQTLNREAYAQDIPVEIGSDDPKVSFFEIDLIKCGYGLDTAVRTA